MRWTLINAAVAAALVIVTSPRVEAGTITINPSDDAAIYVASGIVIHNQYLTVANSIDGAVKFPTNQISGEIGSALLSVNPYGLPLAIPNLSVYGYISQTGTISASDVNAGTFLGTWTLPSNLGFGKDAYFDVTQFVANADAPYVGFILEGVGGPDIFSSLEYNYGHPAQLAITFVPEPSSSVLVAIGLGFLVLWFYRHELKIRIGLVEPKVVGAASVEC